MISRLQIETAYKLSTNYWSPGRGGAVLGFELELGEDLPTRTYLVIGFNGKIKLCDYNDWLSFIGTEIDLKEAERLIKLHNKIQNELKVFT